MDWSICKSTNSANSKADRKATSSSLTELIGYLVYLNCFWERCVKAFRYNWGFDLCLYSILSVSALCISKLWWNFSIIRKLTPFYPFDDSHLNPSLPNSNTAIQVFLLTFAWYIFFHPFIFNIPVPIYLRSPL